MSSTPDPSFHRDHVQKMDTALRDEDVLERQSAADTVRSDDEPLAGDEPITGAAGHGRVIPNTPTADEEAASAEAFEAGVDAAEDEVRSAGRRTPSDEMAR